MKRFRATVKFKDGSFVRVTTLAKDRDEARQIVEAQQDKRVERFPLTFERIEMAKETGSAGAMAIDPRFTGQALTEAWVKAETQRRKKDEARYEKGYEIAKIEEIG